MSLRVVENVINAFSKHRRFLTRERLTALAGLASYLLTLASTKRPALAPIREAFTTLVTPAEGDEAGAEPKETTQNRIVQQIHVLREKIPTATKSEKTKLRVQIDALTDLL